MQRHRLLLVDDNDLIRAGLFHVLANTLGGNVIGQAGGLVSAAQMIKENDVNILLLKNRMPDGDVGNFMSGIKLDYPAVKTLILLEEEQDFWNAMSFEADGYELRQMPTYQLFAAIKAIGEGYAWIGPLLSRYLLKRAGRDCLLSASQVQPSIDRASFGLSVREKEILTLLSEGLSGLKIAEKLSISPKTVKLHISNCIRKMDVDDRSQAIAKFLRAKR